MNREGFEKWYRPAYSGSMARDDHNEYKNQDTWEAFEAWQAAIRSLEVTPELVGIGMRAEVGPWMLCDLVADPNYLDDIVESVLTAAINAIKERSHV